MPLIRDALGGSHARKRHELPRLWGRKTSAGIDVTPERAMQISTVYACVTTHADDASQLPLGLYRRTASGRQRVEGHPTMRLLTEEPNPTMDAVEMWQNVFGYEGIRGNALLFVERNNAGQPVGLWPIAPSSAEPRRITQAADRSRVGRIVWNVNLATWEYAPIPDNGIVQPEDMLHFRLFGLGPMGLSPVGLARQQIGTSFAAQDYIGGFFARDASPGGVLSVDGELTDEQFERLEHQWKDLHEGVGNSHRLSILEGGAKWANVSLSPNDAKFLEVIKAGRQDIASMYRMPLHKIGDLDRATFNNIEQLSIEYVAGLTPYLVRGERVARKLFDDPNLYLKFDAKGLLRSDIQTRYAAYAMARQWGWASANDIRRDEDEDPIPNGDVYLQPLNMVEGGTKPAEPGRAGRARGARSATGRQRIADSYQPKIADADRTVAKLERAEVGKLLAEDLAASPAAFAAAVTALYDGTITGAAVKAFGPVFAALASEIVTEAADEVAAESSNVDAWVAAYTAGHVEWRTGQSESELSTAVSDTEDPAGAVRALLDQWVEDRPDEAARSESNQLSRAAARVAWRDAGVRSLRWRTRGKSCQMCQHLDGREVAIERPFVAKGETIPGGEDQNDLTARRNHYTPPLHPGCDCDIEPA